MINGFVTSEDTVLPAINVSGEMVFFLKYAHSDAFIANCDGINTNFGRDPLLHTRHYLDRACVDRRSFIRFNLKDFTPNSVQRATLMMRAKHFDRNYVVHVMGPTGNGWIEGGVTWRLQPRFGQPICRWKRPPDMRRHWDVGLLECDVTSHIRAHAGAHVSFALHGAFNIQKRASMFSREAEEEWLRPRLIIGTLSHQAACSHTNASAGEASGEKAIWPDRHTCAPPLRTCSQFSPPCHDGQNSTLQDSYTTSHSAYSGAKQAMSSEPAGDRHWFHREVPENSQTRAVEDISTPLVQGHFQSTNSVRRQLIGFADEVEGHDTRLRIAEEAIGLDADDLARLYNRTALALDPTRPHNGTYAPTPPPTPPTSLQAKEDLWSRTEEAHRVLTNALQREQTERTLWAEANHKALEDYKLANLHEFYHSPLGARDDETVVRGLAMYCRNDDVQACEWLLPYKGEHEGSYRVLDSHADHLTTAYTARFNSTHPERYSTVHSASGPAQCPAQSYNQHDCKMQFPTVVNCSPRKHSPHWACSHERHSNYCGSWDCDHLAEEQMSKYGREVQMQHLETDNNRNAQDALEVMTLAVKQAMAAVAIMRANDIKDTNAFELAQENARQLDDERIRREDSWGKSLGQGKGMSAFVRDPPPQLPTAWGGFRDEQTAI